MDKSDLCVLFSVSCLFLAESLGKGWYEYAYDAQRSPFEEFDVLCTSLRRCYEDCYETG